jgi:hypothetical protein
MWIVRLLKVAAANPAWFADVLRVGVDTLRGRNNWESHENGLKAAALKYGVDYHQFGE